MKKHNISFTWMLIAFFSVCIISRVKANDWRWNNSTDNNYNNGTNWSGQTPANSPPGNAAVYFGINSYGAANNNTAYITNNAQSGSLTIGYNGYGNTLTISNGALLNGNGGELRVGADNSANSNSLFITGAGTVVSNYNVFYNGTGDSVSNTVVISAGATFTNTGGFNTGWRGTNNYTRIDNATLKIGGELRVGDQVGFNNTLVITNGSLVVVAGNIYSGVAANANGNNLIIAGGSIMTNFGSASLSYDGNSNITTVSDSGTFWRMANGDNRIGDISGGKNGKLIISNGATVSAGGIYYLGVSGTNNQVLVTGNGSLFTNSGEISVNYGGTGNKLTVDNGARVKTGLLTLNTAGDVELNGGSLEANSLTLNKNMTVGDGTQKARLQVNTGLGGAFSGGGKANISSNAILAIGAAQSVTLANLVANNITTNVGSGFGGTGTLTGDFTYANGSTVAPGNSPGTFTQVGTVTFGTAGNYDWEINSFGGTAGTDPGWDLFNITGTLDITATSGNKFNINLLSLTTNNIGGVVYDFNSMTSYSNMIASATSITGFSADKFNINTAGFSNSYLGSWTVGVQGNALYLYYIAIPEPSTYALLAFGAIWAVIIARRRSRKPARTSV